LHLVTRESGDHTLDLAPVTESSDVSVMTAPSGALSRFKDRVAAVELDEFCRVSKRKASMDEGRVHARFLTPRRFASADKCRQCRVDQLLVRHVEREWALGCVSLKLAISMARGRPCVRVAAFYEGCSSRWRIAEPSAKSATMQGSSTRAGGCFLTIFILLGFLFGLSIQNPLKGTLIGTGVGAALAVLTWIVDLRRRGS
jgi:hypothetical protein